MGTEKTIKLTSGVWYWKDDTNTLEFASIFQDECSASLPEERLADNEEKICKLSKWIKHEYVTLDDVKYLAFLLEEENESHRMLPFAAVMGNKKLDEFLMALLFYMSFYLEKLALEKKIRSLISTVIFLENKEMDDVLAKLAVAKIYLAKVYSNLVLGGGIAPQSCTSHGMRKTSLQKDRNFFEGFYNFCSYVTWLVFRRKHFQVIREEIGRLLCSDTFNLASRDRSHVFLQKAGDQTIDANAVRLPCQRVGIIGADCSELNSLLLQSDGTVEEEDQDQDEEQREEQGKLRSHSFALTKDPSLSVLSNPEEGLVGRELYSHQQWQKLIVTRTGKES
ncbi:hypothetical protein ASZ78_008907 [Callipepla squamata]|uniref:Protein phosphatase 1 regulatory subunit 36 n=1 Tax=Callipepla squamata TaxID=9009 RepID=A0A226MWV5_CALSU|nr:hypothetical protein ASZ78_008907 [Callipepla squamata]